MTESISEKDWNTVASFGFSYRNHFFYRRYFSVMGWICSVEIVEGGKVVASKVMPIKSGWSPTVALFKLWVDAGCPEDQENVNIGRLIELIAEKSLLR